VKVFNSSRTWRTWLTLSAAASIWGLGFAIVSANTRAPEAAGKAAPVSRFAAAVRDVAMTATARGVSPQTAASNPGCVGCHKETGDPHPGDVDRLTCTDCHGGNGTATAKEQAHTARPSNPEKWHSSANPHESYTLLNNENWAWIRFVNPSDSRVAPSICAKCHAGHVNSTQIGSMMNSAQVYSTALYNNGSVPFKDARFAENYSMKGEPQVIHTVPPPTPEETRLKGILPSLFPLPRFEVVQAGTILRVFERGGGPKSELGNPNRDDIPGQPDVFLSNRGFGTQNRVDPVPIGAQKTRLNDPVLAFMGTNDAPGDYRQSGCASCHVIYANDRDKFNAGPYAQFGNGGLTQNPDPSIPKNEEGHPIKHEFTRAIPSSQCITCHVHNGNGFLNTYLGYMWWDEETDGEHLYPKEQHDPTPAELDKAGRFNPEEAAARGLWNDPAFLKTVSEKNPQLKNAQFSDYHGHGWMFQRVYSRDKKGNLLDAAGAQIAYDDPQKWEKAVHLKDIHLEKGMHCVDCHFSQDVHGTGKIIGDRRAAIEVACEDCHGTTSARATLMPSGPAASGTAFNSPSRTTPFGTPQFLRRGQTLIQRSMVTEGLQWEIPQVIDTITPGNPRYSEASRLAKTIQTDGRTWGDGTAPPERLAHDSKQMTCYACHSSWTTNCFGCHLAAKVNTRKPMLHNEGDVTQVYASYNPQVLRADGYMLGIDGTIQGHRVAPVRSSSVVTFSVQNGNRAWIVNQAPTTSSPGFNGNAFNTHPPHTVRGKETKVCTDCHVSAEGDNNAWMSSLLMLGSNQVNYMTSYIYVAQDRGGVGAVGVTERTEPEAVFGSHLQQIAYPSNFADHQERGGRLEEVHGHGGRSSQVQLYGEFLLSVGGSRGFEVFDIANIGNKDFAQRITTAPFANQVMKVKTADATGLAIGSASPLDPKRVQLPENEEQKVAPLFGYAFVSDRVEGLVTIDITTISDGIPTNNRLRRAATFNPNNELTGATSITLAGNYAYLTTPTGLVIVDVSNPTSPSSVAKVGAPLNNPKRVAVQFRYAFVLDNDGLKVVNISNPARPAVVQGAAVPIAQANGIYVARTYAYVAAGKQGLVIVDVERPERPRLDQEFNANGQLVDARDVKVGMTNTSLFAYVADGAGGLKVLEVLSPAVTTNNQGYSPRPAPKLIASARTSGTAVYVSEGYRRDRAVDESGNQLSVFGRRGARPFNLTEMRRFYMKPDGTVWTVTNRPPGPAARSTSAPLSSLLGALWALLGTGAVMGVVGGVGIRAVRRRK
jgi:hypothetical protein